MKKEILYHGSNMIVKAPVYGKGNIYNDYGRGFYCTKHKELGKEWSVSETGDGFLNVYEIDTSNLKILNLLDDKYNILHWLALLLDNRMFVSKSAIAKRAKEYILDNYLINTKQFDYIIGYRADDSYFSFARDFINNTISINQLESAMKLGNLKEQHVLISKKAFKQIKFNSYEIVSFNDYYPKRIQRDLEARNDYLNISSKVNKNEIFIRDLLNGVNYE